MDDYSEEQVEAAKATVQAFLDGSDVVRVNLGESLRVLLAHIEQLQAVVGKLPVTADGVIVTSPWERVWKWTEHTVPRLQSTRPHFCGWHHVHLCYSTRAAAEAAAAEGGGDG